MRDPDGTEWLTANEAAHTVRVRPGTIYTWGHRGDIRSIRIGPRRYYHLGDIRHAEHAWRTRLQKAADQRV